MSDFEDTTSIYDNSDSESETSEISETSEPELETETETETETNDIEKNTKTTTDKTEDDESSSSDDEDDIKLQEDEEDKDDESEENSDSDSDLDNEDEDEDDDYDLEEEEEEEKPKKGKKGETKKTTITTIDQTGGDDSDDEYDDVYLQKFNEEINKNYISDNHPECVNVNFDEIIASSKVIRDSKNNIVDDLHKTLPYLTKYEKARILGQRAKQINSGMTAFVKVPENIIDGYLIAEMELAQKRIPFIIKRPVPGGGCEYWRVSDLELIDF
uniref:Uncharacterized protein n=1 Tax=viral metagenome TaxID=1070528 RepID=A0A6C0KUF0_9ZZZZ